MKIIKTVNENSKSSYEILDIRSKKYDQIGICCLDMFRSSDNNIDLLDREIIFRLVEFFPNTTKILMHKTNSIDYGVIVEGQIDLVLDNCCTTLYKGDCFIQDKTNHAWVNKYNNICKIVFFMKFNN
jgi:hypothetical protein